MPRTPPPKTPEQQKEDERRAALAALDVAALRAWADKYAIALLGDDQTVLISAHESRVIDPKTPAFLRRESIRWLREQYPESAVLKNA